MAKKIRKLLGKPRVIIYVLVVIMAFISIYSLNPRPFGGGVAIRSVVADSAAALAGIENPKPYSAPMSREVILSMNNVPIKTEKDYYDIVGTYTYNMTVEIKTTKASHRLFTKPLYKTTVLPELVPVTTTGIKEVNESVNGTMTEVNRSVDTITYVNKTSRELLGMEDLGLVVYAAPSTNIRKGLDLAGGTRVVLRPEQNLSSADFDMLLSSLEQRLNVYGLSDIQVKKITDLSGTFFVLVEVAGAKKSEVNELLAKQGKFEAMIGKEKVFIGGERDVTYVCMGGNCAGFDPQAPCGQVSDGTWACRFRFAIALSPAAAERFATATNGLQLVQDGESSYLSEDLQLMLDDALVDTLKISGDLKGRAETDIEITGSGSGATETDAAYNALDNMKRLQTILKTGSLPTKLSIEQLSSISPTLGKGFIRNAFLLGLLSLGGIVLMVTLRYRRPGIVIPIVLIIVSEIIIVLGFAGLVGWNMDLSAIAGLIIVIGTSVNDQTVIADEMTKGSKQEKGSHNYKERVKRAFFIIIGAWLTICAAMIPLLWAGAGLLKGFAITTIVGATIGVLITRPAYNAMVEVFIKE